MICRLFGLVLGLGLLLLRCTSALAEEIRSPQRSSPAPLIFPGNEETPVCPDHKHSR